MTTPTSVGNNVKNSSSNNNTNTTTTNTNRFGARSQHSQNQSLTIRSSPSREQSSSDNNNDSPPGRRPVVADVVRNSRLSSASSSYASFPHRYFLFVCFIAVFAVYQWRVISNMESMITRTSSSIIEGQSSAIDNESPHYLDWILLPSPQTSTSSSSETSSSRSSLVNSRTSSHMNRKMDIATPIATIAYAVSITHCTAQMNLDGAAVVKHSVHLSSIREKSSNSKYDYHMYAFVHPNASECTPTLELLGYTVLLKETPVDIRKEVKNNDEFVRRVTSPNSGCCAEKEFLKLYSYTLTDYPVAVHLDLDVMVLKPLDDLFDVMILHPPNATKIVKAGMWETNVTHPINSFFTLDYPMSPNRPLNKIGMQGGFWVVRPDVAVFEEYCNIIRRGEFITGEGWTRPGDALHWGGYFGAAQIQGIVAYYYGRYQPNTHVELNRCLYNQMVDNPYSLERGGMKCIVPNEDPCQDCRRTDISKIYTAHFTFCAKPWWCPYHRYSGSQWDEGQDYLCSALHHEWHRIRKHLEFTVFNNNKHNFSKGIIAKFARPRKNWTDFRPDRVKENSFGHCHDGKHYLPIPLPKSNPSTLKH